MNGLGSISSANISKRYQGLKTKNAITAEKPVKPAEGNELARSLIEKQRMIENDIPGVEIDTLIFKTMSAEEIKARAVVKCDNPEQEGPGTVRDQRLGPRHRNEQCATCMLNLEKCPGHFGYIEVPPLPTPDQDFLQMIINTASVVCQNCGGLLFTEDDVKRNGLHKLSFKNRLLSLRELCAKRKCSYPPEKEGDFPCAQLKGEGAVPIYQTAKKMMQADDYKFPYTWPGKDKTVEYRTPEEMLGILDNITNRDAELIGYSEGSHPRDLIITALPVIPYIARPDMFQGDRYLKDDITREYRDIIKESNRYFKTETSLAEREKLLRSIYGRIRKLFRSETKKGEKGKEFSDFRRRVQGKEGIIRSHLMGKRVDFVGRTVAGPGNYLRVDEIGVPREMAAKLSVPVTCTEYNKEELQAEYDAGRVLYIDMSQGKFKGTRAVINDLFRSLHPNYQIKVRERVHRQLRNGDIILVNRYPSLHKPSIMAGYTKIISTRNIQINLSLTTPLHADFDGDELNIHVPQTIEAIAEATHILNVANVIMSDETARPMMGIVYDALAILYILTRNEEEELLRHEENRDYETFVDSWNADIIQQGKNIPKDSYAEWKKEKDAEFDRLKKQRKEEMEKARKKRASEYAGSDAEYNRYTENLPETLKEQLRQGERMRQRYTQAESRLTDLRRRFNLGDISLKATVQQAEQEDNEAKRELDRVIAETIANPDYQKLESLGARVGLVDRILYNNAIMAVADRPQIATLNRRLQTQGVPIYTKRGIVSAAFPESFYYRAKGVVIRDGILISGSLGKDTLGTKEGSIIAEMYIQLGQRATVDFMSDVQLISNNLSSDMGFSIGISDCFPDNPQEFREKLDAAVAEAKVKVVSLTGRPKNEFEAAKQEARIKSALDVAKDVSQKNVTVSTNPNNAFIVMANSGSKGTALNFTMAASILGQQNLNGERMATPLPGKRSLPLFDLNDTSPEARGFCINSFMSGLTAPEFFFHNTAGREGLVDTSVNTAKTGDLQHRIVKATEDAHIIQGGVRDSSHYLIMPIYGEDGFNISKLASNKIRGKIEKLPFDLDQMLNQINETF